MALQMRCHPYPSFSCVAQPARSLVSWSATHWLWYGPACKPRRCPWTRHNATAWGSYSSRSMSTRAYVACTAAWCRTFVRLCQPCPFPMLSMSTPRRSWSRVRLHEERTMNRQSSSILFFIPKWNTHTHRHTKSKEEINRSKSGESSQWSYR